MANSIRVKSATEYVIEVNDKGETISFDTSDTTLASRIFKAIDKTEALQKEYKEKEAEIDKRPDEPYNEYVTKNQYDKLELINSFYIDARAAMDMFLGDGACQKIFGDKNYLTMFDDLTKQLEPHFKKMGISAEKLKTSVAKKYAPNRQQRRSLK